MNDADILTATKSAAPVATDAAMVAERVTAICDAAADGRKGPRSAIFLGTVPLLDLAREAVRDGRVLDVDCATGGMDSLVPLRSLIEVLVPELRTDAPDLLDRYSPELVALHPDLADVLDLPVARRLTRLANTPSERRSHRESEHLFRTVNGLGRLLHDLLERTGAPVVLVWRNLHEADAATLLAFRRLSRWADQGQTRLVSLATLVPGGIPNSPPAGLPAAEQACFDWPAHHARLLDLVREQSLGTEVAVEFDAGTPAGTTPALGPTPIGEALLLLSIDVERGCAQAIRAMGAAAFTLNYEAVLQLAAHVIAAVTGQEEPFDEARFAAEWEAAAPEEYYAAIEFAVIRPADVRDVLAVAWRAAGFANSCLDDHETSLACYRQALGLADTPLQRARARMYLGLITGKRLRRIAEAEQHLDQGLAEIDGRDDEDARLERCWLLNVRALMAFQQRDHRRAMLMVREAREVMRPLHSSEATHLKINLISNISVLLEKTGRTDKAVALWQQFAAFLGPSNELFAKHYYFREGGLRLLAGRSEDALTSYRNSYEQCVRIDDPFHAAVVARAAGYVAHQLGRQDEAVEWYERVVRAGEACGDHEALTADRGTLAFLSQDGGSAPVRPDTKLNRPFSLVNTYLAGEG
ncbi:tetratricopeptide repeat protein [Saccharothrix sp. NRRL B-16314]|uniref:tetratricopeptide repeat protein n=1 Tax=Saccharothrix sp. NRRL B-16314 TaxID=1463825 RepID=UPI0005246339|nr:tetratricopeptide repeat protein [Saccharothrix sp. NRRL B-16314]